MDRQQRTARGARDAGRRDEGADLRGAYGYVGEFDLAARAIADRRVDLRPLIERRAPLEDAIELFAELAYGRLDAVKVMLVPVSG